MSNIEGGFFNSKDHDRRYSAYDFARVFDGILSDGVFAGCYTTKGREFQVTAAAGMTITVGPGKAWFNQTWSINMKNIVLEVPVNTSTITYAVILDIDKGNRENSIKIVAGPGGDAKPTMIHTLTKHQYPLAWVKVPANTTSSMSFGITRVVGTSDCKYATSPLINTDLSQLGEHTFMYKEYNGVYYDVPHLSPDGTGTPGTFVIDPNWPTDWHLKTVIMKEAWPMSVWAPCYMPRAEIKTTDLGDGYITNKLCCNIYSAADRDQRYRCSFIAVYTL